MCRVQWRAGGAACQSSASRTRCCPRPVWGCRWARPGWAGLTALPQVWHLPTATLVRAVPVNVLSYRLRNQFVFVLNKPSQVTTVVPISSYKLFYLT